jgi:hypothetical protein
MDTNKVWLTGLVTCDPTYSEKKRTGTSVTTFTLEVVETYHLDSPNPQTKSNVFTVESLGLQAEKSIRILKKGMRATVEGYLRSDGPSRFCVRSFSIIPEPHTERPAYYQGLFSALEILRTSAHKNSAAEKIESLIKGQTYEK